MDLKHFAGPGFEMQVPTDWFISSSPEHQAVFLSPKQENTSASLVVDMQRVSPDFKLEDARLLLQRVRGMIDKEAEVLQEIEDKLDGVPSCHSVYKLKPEGAKQALLQRQMAAVVEGMLVTLTASRPAGPQVQLDAILAGMIASFKFS